MNGNKRRRAIEKRREIEDLHNLNDRLAELLTGVCLALKGPPPPNMLYSWHDLPEVAAALKAERDALYNSQPQTIDE